MATEREVQLELALQRVLHRCDDLLEILRLWEPDHSSAEHRREIYFAREAATAGRHVLNGAMHAPRFPAEERLDQAKGRA